MPVKVGYVHRNTHMWCRHICNAESLLSHTMAAYGHSYVAMQPRSDAWNRSRKGQITKGTLVKSGYNKRK